MRSSLSLIRREFTAYFLGPVGYVAAVLVLAGMGVLFHFTLDLMRAEGSKGIEFPMQGLLGNVGFWLIFWVIPPLLTMRLFAEERAAGTLEALMTAPVRDSQVVLCKFFACLAFYLLMWLPTLLYLPILLDLKFYWPGWDLPRTLIAGGAGALLLGLIVAIFATDWLRLVGSLLALVGLALAVGGEIMLRLANDPFCPVVPNIDPMPVVTSYLGLFLVGAMFIALGLWVSSLVKNPIVAALLALALNLLFILGGLLVLGGFYAPPSDGGGRAFQAMSFLSVPLHFGQDFSRGVIDSRNVILYLSVTLVGLFLTTRSLERRRMQ